MKINILQGAFLPVPSCRGGAIEKAWFELGKAFVKHGHQVTHVSRLCDELPREEVIDGVTHKRIVSRDAVANPYLLKLCEFPYVWRARKTLLPADILVTHAFWAPLIMPPQKFGKIYVHVGRYPKGQLKLYNKAKRFQVPSLAVAEAAKREIGTKSHKVSVMPYPIPWEIEPRLPIEGRPKRMLYFGRIHPEKGVLSLVKAWVRLSRDQSIDWTLRIVGPWRRDQGGGGLEYRNQIKNLIEKEKASVELLEPIFKTSQIKKEYQSARIFIYPSLAEKGETFGLSVLESMSMGCVPVVSSLPCFNDITTSECAFIIPKSESFESSLMRTLSEILMVEPRHSILSSHAYEKSMEFTVDKVAQKFLNDFKKIL